MEQDTQQGSNRDAVQQELQARRGVVGQPPRYSMVRWVIIGAALVLVLAVIGVYLVKGRSHSEAPTAATRTTTAPQVQPDTVSDTSTKQYVSNGSDLNLSFTYPASWTAQPASNSNPSDHPITVTSPKVSIAGANDTSTTGKLVVSIQPGGTNLSELAGDNATAAQNSVQIAYNKPTSAQHQYPYISFVHLAGGNNSTGVFEEVAVTGITTFSKSQTVYQASLAQLDPVITVRFYSCTSGDCSATTPLSITADIWQNDSSCQQALALLQSLQIN